MAPKDNDQDGIQKQTQQALLALLLTSQFRVTQESVGVPFLIGKKIKVVRQAGLNPSLPPSYCIEPTEIRLKDDRFLNLFGGLKPTVRDMQEGKIFCTDGIVAELVMEADDEA